MEVSATSSPGIRIRICFAAHPDEERTPHESDSPLPTVTDSATPAHEKPAIVDAVHVWPDEAQSNPIKSEWRVLIGLSKDENLAVPP